MAIVDMVVSDMTKNLDPTQYGNRKATSIQHYLVIMLQRILSQTDGVTKGETRAVLCTLIDWQEAYSRQSHILGVRSFSANGVRPSLLPSHILLHVSGDENKMARKTLKTSTYARQWGDGL